MKYLDWLKTNPEKGYYWVRPYDCYDERIDEFTDWYDNAGNVETKFTEQPDEVISDILTYIDYLDMVGHCGAYSEENTKLKELMKETKSAISSALNFLSCMDRISETECNEQLAFDVLRKALEELDK